MATSGEGEIARIYITGGTASLPALAQELPKPVVKAGYKGYIGIEYEGAKHTEIEGIKRTKQALEELRSMMS